MSSQQKKRPKRYSGSCKFTYRTSCLNNNCICRNSRKLSSYQVNYVVEIGIEMKYFKFNRLCETTVLKNIFLHIIYHRKKWLAGPFSYLKLKPIVHAAFLLDVHSTMCIVHVYYYVFAWMRMRNTYLRIVQSCLIFMRTIARKRLVLFY